MAEFLTTKGITHAIDQIIKNAEEKLWIISPYLKIDRHFEELLEERACDSPNVDIRVIYRSKKKLRPEVKNWLAGYPSIRTSFRENLHAKCYLNEKEAILTSMNLYEFSQANNDEMGILVSREDTPLYDSILRESRRILRNSEEVREMVATVNRADDLLEQPKYKAKQPTEMAIAETAKNGHCIRCKTSVPLKPLHPYCRNCFRSWNRAPDYKEKYCHACGNDTATTKNKPACLPCYRKYRYDLEFAEA